MISKIVLFTSEFPYGQQETFLETEMAYLSQSFEKIYIVPLFKNKSIRHLNFTNIEICEPVDNVRNLNFEKFLLFLNLNFLKILFKLIRNSHLNIEELKKIVKQALIIFKVLKYLKSREHLTEADLWYFYWGTNSVNVLPFLSKHPSSVARYHRYDLFGPETAEGVPQILQGETLSQLDLALCISTNGENYLKNKYPQFSHKVKLSRLGVSDNGIAESSKDGVLRIVTCSNIYPVKRLELIPKALKQIKDIKIEWTHLGDGPSSYKKRVTKELKTLSPNISFNFRGRLPNKEIMNFYKKNPVDLFINTSVIEGVPVSVMEALSFGIPVIATNVGGTSEILNEDYGKLLSPSLKPNELAIAIVDFFKHKYGNQETRENARNAWKTLANESRHYSELIETLKETNKKIF